MPAGKIRTRFPGIHKACLQEGIDISQEPIPVVPAAHYFCGGVLVDEWGRTSLRGLYAVGEVSCTGLHGANRLASTSLLESLLWGHQAAQDIASQAPSPTPVDPASIREWDDGGLTDIVDPALIHGDMQTIRNIMWHYVGLLRNQHRLDRALRTLQSLSSEIEEFYRSAALTDALLGLRNAVQSAIIVTRAARQNPVSLGCHHREDAPAKEGQ